MGNYFLENLRSLVQHRPQPGLKGDLVCVLGAEIRQCTDVKGLGNSGGLKPGVLLLCSLTSAPAHIFELELAGQAELVCKCSGVFCIPGRSWNAL